MKDDSRYRTVWERQRARAPYAYIKYYIFISYAYTLDIYKYFSSLDYPCPTPPPQPSRKCGTHAEPWVSHGRRLESLTAPPPRPDIEKRFSPRASKHRNSLTGSPRRHHHHEFWVSADPDAGGEKRNCTGNGRGPWGFRVHALALYIDMITLLWLYITRIIQCIPTYYNNMFLYYRLSVCRDVVYHIIHICNILNIHMQYNY